MKQAKDRIGEYFLRYCEAMGVSTAIEVGTHYHDGSKVVDTLDHAVSDAYGALLRISEKRGEELLELPRGKTPETPSFLFQILALRKYLQGMSKTLEPTLHRNLTESAGETFAYHIFELDESKVIQSWCKSNRLSLTAFLTWALHRAIGVQSNVGEHSCRWSLPVSLKGPLQLGEKANHAVPIFFSLDSSTSRQMTQDIIQEQLSSGMPWGAYRMLHALSFLPNSFYRALIRRDERSMRAKGQWFAIFSNVGAIKGDRRIHFRTLKVIANEAAPIKSNCLSWNGLLTLNISVHNTMAPHSIEASSLMKCWKDIVLACIFDSSDSTVLLP